MFVLLVIVNVLVFLHESSLRTKALRQFVWTYAFIPSRVGFTGGSMVVRAPADLLQKISTMVTSQFLHAGWLHLLSNMVVLLFLGKKVEERIGPLKFLAFYLASGIAGNIVYAALHLSSHEPVENRDRDGIAVREEIVNRTLCQTARRWAFIFANWPNFSYYFEQ